MGWSHQEELPKFYSSQITSPLNGLVDFLKSLNAAVLTFESWPVLLEES